MNASLEDKKKVGCLTIFADGTFMLRNIPTWYPQIAHPKAFEAGSAEKYSLTAFLDKKEHAEEIKALETYIRNNMAKGEDWDDVPSKNRCLLDGKKVKGVDEDSDIFNTYRLRFSANDSYPPAVRNGANEKLNRDIPEQMKEIESLAKNGKMMTILSSFYGWKHPKYGAGMTLNLLAVKISSKFTNLKLGASGVNDGDDLDWGEDEDEDDL